jgi:hypothetical protein
MDSGLALRAPRNDGADMVLPSRERVASEWYPSLGEGAGNAGGALRPGSHAQWRRRARKSLTSPAEAPPHPLRNGLTAYAVLSPATNSSCHRRRRLCERSQIRSGRTRHRRLGTSHGCQDHTSGHLRISILISHAFFFDLATLWCRLPLDVLAMAAIPSRASRA